MIINKFIHIANGLIATVYGFGEKNCGDVDKPVKCAVGATTASGLPFDPAKVIAALAAPSNVRIRPGRIVHLRLEGSTHCVKIKLADKMNERYIGQRGFDLTPAAIVALGSTPHKHWSNRVFICEGVNVNDFKSSSLSSRWFN